MTSTNRGAARQSDDFYETQAEVVRAILPHLTPGPVIDPFCGRGAILDVVETEWKPSWTEGIELDAGRANAAAKSGGAKAHRIVSCRDAFSDHHWNGADDASIITNPPYSQALKAILRAATEARRRERAFLLRLDFLGSKARAQFHRENPCDVHVLPWRPEFVASLKCKADGCGWAKVQPLDEPRSRKCPRCGAGGLQISTTDSNEYGWFVYGPGRGGRWSILDA